MRPEIILASSSPVRKEVMDNLRVVYRCQPSKYEEKMELTPGESFEDLVERLALGKAREVAPKVSQAIVIAADSFAVLNEEILGKPQTENQAIEYLNRLSGGIHKFYTGMAIVDTEEEREVVDHAVAKVHFRVLTPDEIQQYVEREEVITAAAAYKIQGLGSALVEMVEGDFYSIVGLSPSKLTEMFKKLNRNLFDYILSLSSGP